MEVALEGERLLRPAFLAAEALEVESQLLANIHAPQGATLHLIVLQTMSHIPLDLAGAPSVAVPMDSGHEQIRTDWLTSTQVGAIGEAVLAAGLVHASKGRLAPFKPFADDGGVDLLLYDKLSRQSVPVQIKCRTALDNLKAGIVEFNVRLSTFTREGGGYLLAALLNGTNLQMGWLIPVRELEAVARRKAEKLVITPCIIAGSADRYRRFRHDDLGALTDAVIRSLPSTAS